MADRLIGNTAKPPIRRGPRTEYRGRHIRTNLTGREYEHLQAVAASQGIGMAAVLRESFLSAYPIAGRRDDGEHNA